MSKDMWIVYCNEQAETEIFDDYDKAMRFYTELEDNAKSYDGIDPDEKIYFAKVTKYMYWKENKDMPLSKEKKRELQIDETEDVYHWDLEERKLLEEQAERMQKFNSEQIALHEKNKKEDSYTVTLNHCSTCDILVLTSQKNTCSICGGSFHERD